MDVWSGIVGIQWMKIGLSDDKVPFDANDIHTTMWVPTSSSRYETHLRWTGRLAVVCPKSDILRASLRLRTLSVSSRGIATFTICRPNIVGSSDRFHPPCFHTQEHSDLTSEADAS